MSTTTLKINNPSKLIKIWSKIKAIYEKGKKPAMMNEKGEKQKTGIKTSLKTLKMRASEAQRAPDQPGPFEKAKKKTLKLLRVFIRYLRAAKDEDKTRKPKFIKKIKQLATIIAELDYRNLDNTEIEEDVNLDELENLDTSAFDESLEKPETTEEEEDENEDAISEPNEETEQPAAPKVPDTPKASNSDQFKEKLIAVKGLIDELKGLAPGDVNKFSADLPQALALAKGKDFAQGTVVLTGMEQGLREAIEKVDVAEVEELANGENQASVVLLQQSRLLWEKTRKSIQAEIQTLENAILTIRNEQSQFDPNDIATGTKVLHVVLDQLDTQLTTELDNAVIAADPTQRLKHQKSAANKIAEYLQYVKSDPLMAEIDANGFVGVSIQKKALSALNVLKSKL